MSDRREQIEIPVLFIVGPPRSGNTILGRVLGAHPKVAPWFEPYYIWDRRFRERPDDHRGESDASEKVTSAIRKAYQNYWKAFNAQWVVDKSPRNCLKIPFIRKIFPEARFIFVLRDGRDVILSMTKQWEKRRGLVMDPDAGARWSKRFRVLKSWLSKRPLWRYRFQALAFEIGPPRLWIKGEFLHRRRWGGKLGWGPQFRGWQEVMDRVTPLEFKAHQWVRCARGILENLPQIPEHRRYVLRYEEFIEDPRHCLAEIFSFLQVEFFEGFMDAIPHVRAGNSGKWVRAFSSDALGTLGPILGETLIALGYERDGSWYGPRGELGAETGDGIHG